MPSDWRDILDEEAHALGQPQGVKAKPQGSPAGIQAPQPQGAPTPVTQGQSPIGKVQDVNSRVTPQARTMAVNGGSYNANAKRPSDFMGYAQYAGMTGDEMERMQKEASQRTYDAQQRAGRALDETAAQMGQSGGAGPMDMRDNRNNPNGNGYFYSSYGDYVKAQQEANTALQRQQQTARGGSWRSAALLGGAGFGNPMTDTQAAAQDEARRAQAQKSGEAQSAETAKRQQAEVRARREAEWNAGQGARNTQAVKAAESELAAAEEAFRMQPSRSDGSGFTSIIHPDEYADIGYEGGFEDTPEARRFLDAQRRLAKAKAGGTQQAYTPQQHRGM